MEAREYIGGCSVRMENTTETGIIRLYRSQGCMKVCSVSGHIIGNSPNCV